MILKPKLKDYLLALGVGGLIYGIIMGFYYCLLGFDLTYGMMLGLLSGALFGGLFALIMAIVQNVLCKKAEKWHNEVSQTDSIICEGPASHKKGAINAIGGWMLLCEGCIRFYAHKLNFGGKNLVIYPDEIIATSTKGNQLIIKTATEEYTFIVAESDSWAKNIGSMGSSPFFEKFSDDIPFS